VNDEDREMLGGLATTAPPPGDAAAAPGAEVRGEVMLVLPAAW
jgi:hypothetical protein